MTYRPCPYCSAPRNQIVVLTEELERLELLP